MEINQAAPQISGCVNRTYAYHGACGKQNNGQSFRMRTGSISPHRTQKE